MQLARRVNVSGPRVRGTTASRSRTVRVHAFFSFGKKKDQVGSGGLPAAGILVDELLGVCETPGIDRGASAPPAVAERISDLIDQLEEINKARGLEPLKSPLVWGPWDVAYTRYGAHDPFVCLRHGGMARPSPRLLTAATRSLPEDPSVVSPCSVPPCQPPT